MKYKICIVAVLSVPQLCRRDGGGKEADRRREQAPGDGRCRFCSPCVPGGLWHAVSTENKWLGSRAVTRVS